MPKVLGNHARCGRDVSVKQTITPVVVTPSRDTAGKAVAGWTLTVLFLSNVMNVGDRMLLGMVAEPVKLELGLSDSQLSLAQGLLFVLSNLAAGLVIARLVDQGNRKRMLAAGIATWSVATAATGLVEDFTTLAIARIGVGLGEATVFPTAMSMIADLFRPTSRGKAIAIYQSSGMVGLTAGTLIAGRLATSLGWRWMFGVCGVAGLFLALLALLTVPEPKRAPLAKPPVASAYLQELLAACRRVLQRPGFIFLTLAFGISAIPGAVLGGWAPAFFQRSHTMPLDQIGLVLASAMGIGGVAGTLGAGAMADWLVSRSGSNAEMLRIPLLTLPLTAPLTAFFALTPNAPGAIAAVFGLSLFLSCAVAPCINYAITEAHPRDRAVTSAIMLAATGVTGGALGPFLVGLVSDILAVEFGRDSLRYAITAMAVTPLIATGFLWAAVRQYSWRPRVLRTA